MNLRLLVALLPLALASGASVTGNVNGFLGVKEIDDEDNPTGNHVAFGVQFDIRRESWPISLAINSIGSMKYKSHDEGQVVDTGVTSEVQLGVKKYFASRDSLVQPWVGGGVVLLLASLERETTFSSQSDSDTGVGLWGSVGLLKGIGEHLNVGLSYTYSWAEVELFGNEGNGGGHILGALVGYHF